MLSHIKEVDVLNKSKEEKEKEFLERLSKLEKMFPGKTLVLPRGTILYRESRDPKLLQENQEFRSASRGDDVFFTPYPVANRTNTAVTLPEPLILLDLTKFTLKEIEEEIARKYQETPAEDQNILWNADEAGFDGYRAQSNSGYVTQGETPGVEIQIFSGRAAALSGGIKIYKGQEG